MTLDLRLELLQKAGIPSVGRFEILCEGQQDMRKISLLLATDEIVHRNPAHLRIYYKPKDRMVRVEEEIFQLL